MSFYCQIYGLWKLKLLIAISVMVKNSKSTFPVLVTSHIIIFCIIWFLLRLSVMLHSIILLVSCALMVFCLCLWPCAPSRCEKRTFLWTDHCLMSFLLYHLMKYTVLCWKMYKHPVILEKMSQNFLWWISVHISCPFYCVYYNHLKKKFSALLCNLNIVSTLEKKSAWSRIYIETIFTLKLQVQF